jgi:hypothetical protein
MELPGQRALIWSVDMRIAPRASIARPPFEYRAKVLRSNPHLDYVDIEVELSSAEHPVAAAALRAFIRRESPASDASALERLLPRSAKLAGKVAIIIGGSRALGAAIVQAPAMQGCTVLATYRDSVADAERVRASVDGLPGTAEMVSGDAADKVWCARWSPPSGGLDILVCNASPAIRPVGLSLGEAQRLRAFVMTSLDLVGVPMAALIQSLSNRSGSCVLISSSTARSSPPDWPIMSWRNPPPRD